MEYFFWICVFSTWVFAGIVIAMAFPKSKNDWEPLEGL